ncbi:hypothetical protein NDU88_005679 [Pleurodeles waltl]|uniref:Uncharacterized protein n=1 Tax=Pleurodeles waltl TaxID=8319 RepID=A0AAV7LQ75_PLEWA|nr:hypothetical protein NDU88_005679 [Pleurodeles waltl]
MQWSLGGAHLKASEEGGRLAVPAPLLEHDHAVGGREVIGAVLGPAETAELSPHPALHLADPSAGSEAGGGAHGAGGRVQTPEVQYQRARLLVLPGGDDLVTPASGPGPIQDTTS